MMERKSKKNTSSLQRSVHRKQADILIRNRRIREEGRRRRRAG